MRVAIVVAIVLFAATPARAQVTIGSLPDPDGSRTCMGSCTLAPVGATAPQAGVITSWRVKTIGQPGPVRLQVIRANAEVGHSALVTPTHDTTSAFLTRIPIAQNDRIALMCCDQTPGGFVKMTNPPGTTDWWEPFLDATPRLPNHPGDAFDVAVSADVEPDGDGDGFGDETQDNCPGTSGTVNGCPPAPPPPAPNQAPTVRFRAPLSGTGVGPSVGIELDVADDSGAPVVSVFDDDGTICVLQAAPYSCTWTPSGADVGRATLLASAVDSAGLSTLGIVRVRVNRFAARLTSKAKRRRGGLRVTGRLVLPAVVTRAQGCSGKVTVRVRKVRRTVGLRSRCTYAAVLKVRTGRPRVSFAGNSVIAPT